MKKLIVGNLKMNILTINEREVYFKEFKKELKGKNFTDCQIVLCTPAVYLESFIKNFNKEKMAIGAQNVFWEKQGSYTGEISAPMVKNLGGEFVIVGHSERRKYFSETNENCSAKIKAALANNLRPIYCVGETLEQRNNGELGKIIAAQIKEALADVSDGNALSVIIAYEPVWAVGSDKTPSSDEILEVRILLKKILTEIYGANVAEKIPVLYGGSVKAEIAQQVCLDSRMDGVLVGRESLNPREFIKIVEIINK